MVSGAGNRRSRPESSGDGSGKGGREMAKEGDAEWRTTRRNDPECGVTVEKVPGVFHKSVGCDTYFRTEGVLQYAALYFARRK